MAGKASKKSTAVAKKAAAKRAAKAAKPRKTAPKAQSCKAAKPSAPYPQGLRLKVEDRLVLLQIDGHRDVLVLAEGVQPRGRCPPSLPAAIGWQVSV
jgi:hypothetical protein